MKIIRINTSKIADFCFTDKRIFRYECDCFEKALL